MLFLLTEKREIRAKLKANLRKRTLKALVQNLKIDLGSRKRKISHCIMIMNDAIAFFSANKLTDESLALSY